MHKVIVLDDLSQEGLDLRCNHLDTTSFALSGEYAPDSDEQAAELSERGTCVSLPANLSTEDECRRLAGEVRKTFVRRRCAGVLRGWRGEGCGGEGFVDAYRGRFAGYA